MTDFTKIATAACALAYYLPSNPASRTFALALRSVLRINNITLPSPWPERLDAFAPRPQLAITGKQLLQSHKIAFAMLNPLLWNAREINRAVNKREDKKGWVNNYRTFQRDFLSSPSERVQPKLTNLAHPICNKTGLYYMEHPDCDPSHLHTPFYTYHAQAWALGLFAEHFATLYGDNYPCPFCQLTAVQLRAYAQAPVVVLAYLHLKHHPPISGTLTLFQPVSSSDKPATYTTKAWLAKIEDEARERYDLNPHHLMQLAHRLVNPILPLPILPKVEPAAETNSDPDLADPLDWLDQPTGQPKKL